MATVTLTKPIVEITGCTIVDVDGGLAVRGHLDRVAELEEALDDILMHGVEREPGWMMVPTVEWDQVVERVKLKPKG